MEFFFQLQGHATLATGSRLLERTPAGRAGRQRLHCEVFQRRRLRAGYPVRSDDGEVIGISCVVEDVTVRNEALAALRQAKDELEQRVSGDE